MKIFILEDSELRREWFAAMFTGESQVDFADTPEKAIDLLKNNTYDRIYLDHDLLTSHYCSDTVDSTTTGLGVAEWLAKNREASRGAIITLHSRNPHGRARMKKALNDGYRFVYEHPFDLMSGLSI